jgi:hypothetical protein
MGNHRTPRGRKKLMMMMMMRRGRKNERKRGRSHIVRARRKNFWYKPPTDSEQKNQCINSFKREKRNKETKNGRKKGRKSHPIEEQKLSVNFQITNPHPPPRNPAPQKAHYGNNEIIL